MFTDITLSSLYARRTPTVPGNVGAISARQNSTGNIVDRMAAQRGEGDYGLRGVDRDVDSNVLEEDRRLRNQQQNQKAKKKRRKNMITANLNGTRYDVSK